MRLTSIDLYSNNSEVAVLSFKDPRSKNPYIAQQVTGLDADEIVPKFYGTNTSGSTKFYELAVNKRELVILISLNPSFSKNVSYSDLRDDLYRAISSSRDGTIQIRLKNGANTVAALTGFVTKFETGLFSKTPQAQLTIQCENGMLRSLEETWVDVNNLLTDTTVVDNKSTAPHGFKFNVTFNGTGLYFTIQDATVPDWGFSVVPDSGFIVDDVLYFSSENNEKALYMVRSGVTTHLVDKITTGSTWPHMFPGANQLQFNTDTTFEWNEFTYYETYWGV